MRRIAFAMVGVVAMAAVALAGPTSIEKTGDSKLLDILKDRNIITEQEHRELSAIAVEETAQSRRSDVEMKVEDVMARGFADDHAPDVGYNKGFVINDGRFSLKVNGRVQFLYENMQFDSSSPSSDSSSFETPRVRLSFSGHAFDDDLRYKIQTDLDDSSDGGRTVLKDAWIQWGNPERGYAFRAGQFKTPFGRQQLVSSGNLQFVSRTGVSDFFTYGRDVGVMLHGDCADGVIGYAVGAFNGEGEERSNDENEHMFVGRLTLNPLGEFGLYESDVKHSEELGISFGANYVYNSLANAGGMPIFGVMTEADEMRVGVDAAARFGGFSLQGEVFSSTVEEDSGLGLEDVDDTGFYVQAGFFLMEPLEIAGRFGVRNHEDDNTGADDDFEEFAIGLNYFFEQHSHKLQIEYAQETFDPDVGSELTDDIIRIQWQLKF